jgi:hypothetical protein
MRRPLIWLLLIAISLALHGLVSSRVGEEIKQTQAATEALNAIAEREKRQVVLEVAKNQIPEVKMEEPPTDEPLDFEEDFQLDPPEVLIAPQAVTPPPPNVPLSLTAQAGGAGEDTQPVEIAIAQQDSAGANLARHASVPTVGLLGPVTKGGSGGGSGGGTAGFGVGIGNALGGSSNQFAAYVQGMREGGLDVLFVVDATGSMGWVLDEVKTRILDITSTVRSLVPISRFGVLAYRDRGDPEFVTRMQNLTYSTLKLQGFLGSLEAKGGGDMFEAVHTALKVGAEDAAWRTGGRRIMILVGDAPPTDANIDDAISAVSRFSSQGGVVSTLDVSDLSNPSVVEARVGRKVNHALYRADPMYQFRNIADAGNGDAATLEGESSITRRLVTLIMGDKFATEMKALLDLL